MFRLTPLFLGLLSLLVFAQQPAGPKPLVHAHAHNDYLHARPLLDALDHGFCSIEADIYLVEGQLLVAHDRAQLKAERTLQALYLDPLHQRVQANGGRVYRNGPTVQLLIDIKTGAEETYPVLRALLKQYADMLTTFTPEKTEPGAVTVVISGNRPRQTMAAEALRYAACDGRLEDLESNPSVHLMPLISNAWGPTFKWRGTGPLPEAEKQKLKAIVAKARQQNRRLRFWGVPDQPAAWSELRAAGVDLLNTDNLPGLQRFLLDGQDR